MQVVDVFKSHIANLCAIVFLSLGFRKQQIQSAPRSATSVALETNISKCIYVMIPIFPYISKEGLIFKLIYFYCIA